ncbi:alpha/beta hydrolase [Gammaproteobacteria bacterium]|nr:alpha/beta hydrolase [Gammaproteobacteria bacterium]
MKPVLSYLYLVVGFYTLIATLLFVFQRSFLYLPDTASLDATAAISRFGIEPITLTTSDGLSLRSWWHPGDNFHSRPVVMILHGNAGHAGYRFPKFAALMEAGFNVLFLEYRGYGGNPGNPTESGLKQDTAAAIRYLGDQGFPTAQVVLYGESLGCGLAIDQASNKRFAAVVLEAPYTSIADVAQDHYWFLPARWLTRDRFDSLSKIKQINAPLLILHGNKDQVIDPEHGRRMFAAASEPKAAVFVPGAGHNDLYESDVSATVIDFLQRLSTRSAD